jgi:alpha-L-fucosidase
MINRREFNVGLAGTSLLASPVFGAAKILSDRFEPSHAVAMSELQRKFLELRFGMYIHLNMATYEQREWGNPNTSPSIFNPKLLNTDQWAEAAISAKMKYGCLTTKHHDGFCLWPTATESPSVKDTPFGRDIVRSYVDSFRRKGLKVCLYFSILDLRANIRHFDITPRKLELIKNQLTELLTNYGEITALVIDGWNAAWSRITYEEVPFLEIYNHVKSLQPNCLMSDYNEGRFPAPVLYYTDVKQYEQHAGQTILPGSSIPSQAANTLQSVWFWKEDFPNEKLRSAHQVVDEWLVPFNQKHCNLILNVAPNRDGRFDPNAVERLAEIGRLWAHPEPLPAFEPAIVITTPDLAFGEPSFASSSADTTGPDLANDNDPGSYWICDEGQSSGWLRLDLKGPVTFNTVAVVEPTYLDSYGRASRITSYRVEAYRDNAWAPVMTSESTKVAVHRVQRTTAERVRLMIQGADKPPGIAEFGLYDEPSRN